jgi:hypothetical protein
VRDSVNLMFKPGELGIELLEHLLVAGSTDRFVVISPPPTDGSWADDAASTQGPQK